MSRSIRNFFRVAFFDFLSSERPFQNFLILGLEGYIYQNIRKFFRVDLDLKVTHVALYPFRDGGRYHIDIGLRHERVNQPNTRLLLLFFLHLDFWIYQAIGVVLVSLLLTMNIFHILF